MKVFSTAILMVFCSLLGSAFSNKCLFCVALNGTDCEGKSIECPENRCMIGSQIYEHGNKKFKNFIRVCADPKLCGAYGSLTQDYDMKIRTYASCCEGENCNTGKFYIPEDDTKPNGLICESSYCEGTLDECNQGKTMGCRGTEIRCIDYRGGTQDPDQSKGNYSLKACINEIGCLENFKCLIGVKELKNVLLKC